MLIEVMFCISDSSMDNIDLDSDEITYVTYNIDGWLDAVLLDLPQQVPQAHHLSQKLFEKGPSSVLAWLFYHGACDIS